MHSRTFGAACVFFGLSLLVGCMPPHPYHHWAHPRADRHFEADRRYCEEQVGPMPSGPERERAVERCLTRRGWSRN